MAVLTPNALELRNEKEEFIPQLIKLKDPIYNGGEVWIKPLPSGRLRDIAQKHREKLDIFCAEKHEHKPECKILTNEALANWHEELEIALIQEQLHQPALPMDRLKNLVPRVRIALSDACEFTNTGKWPEVESDQKKN